MATRKEITETFVGEIRTTLSEWIDHDDVRVYEPNMDEVFPSVVYRADWKSTNDKYGGGSAKTPVGNVLNSDGEEIALLYQDFERLRFDVQLKSQSQSDILEMGEVLKQSWKPYTGITGLWKGSTAFHEDCQDFAIPSGVDGGDGSTEPVSRADIFAVEIEFWRYIRRDGTPIRTAYTDFYFSDDTRDGDYGKQVIVGEKPN